MKGEAYLNLTEHSSDLSTMGREGGRHAKYANDLRDIIEEARKAAAEAGGGGGDIFWRLVAETGRE